MIRAPEITYYDELGVAPEASPDQIREAFRALVRILHPDQQTDPQLKDIADRQMRKLNGIYTVLSDPERRRRYNLSLKEDNRPATIVFSPQRNANINSKLVARLAWAGAAVVIVGTLVALSWDSPATTVSNPAPVEHAASLPHATTTLTAIEDNAQLKSDLRVALAERDAAVRELNRLRGGPPPSKAPAGASAPVEAPPTPAPSLATFTELPTVAAHTPVPFTPAPVQTHIAAVKTLAGFWFYNRPPGQKNSNRALYPPEFIELNITEQNGQLHGRYRSRYHIVDRPISPDVVFEFHASSAGSTIKAPWTGAGGSKGEITMQLSTENAMSVEWNASELGSILGLNSGTAKLTRRIE